MVVSSNSSLLVSMKTYLSGVLEHLKCGYGFDVTKLSQFLGRKRGVVKSQFWFLFSVSSDF